MLAVDLWALKHNTYPYSRPWRTGGKDRILIFEDTNGTETLDKRKVLLKGLNLVLAELEIGMGGVGWGLPRICYIFPIDTEKDKAIGTTQKITGWLGLDIPWR